MAFALCVGGGVGVAAGVFLQVTFIDVLLVCEMVGADFKNNV